MTAPFLFRLARRQGLITVLMLCLISAVSAQQVLYNHGDPTNFEQLMLEMVNTARAVPAAEAGRLRIGLNKNLPPGRINAGPKQPLAFHPVLLEAARRHADWMLRAGIFSHTGLNGSDQTDRAALLGFDFPVAENIARQATSATPNLPIMTRKNHDALFRSAPHRLTLLDPDLTVAGFGVRRGLWKGLNAQMVAQSFSEGGDTFDSGPFIVGVAYADLNRNGAYDPGEGRGGVEVRPESGAYYAVTSASGGFAIPIAVTQTNTEEVPLPFAVNGASLEAALPIDATFRNSRRANAADAQVRLTWDGAALAGPIETTVATKVAARINYGLVGTDGVSFLRTMVTAPSVRADLRLASDGRLAPRLAQRLSFATPRAVTYAPGRVVSLNASASSRLPVVFSSTNSMAEVVGSTILVRGAGQCEITASQAGNDTFELAAPLKRILKVAKAKQVITFRLAPQVSLANGTLVLQAIATSDLPVVFESDRPDLVSISGTTATLHAAGRVIITARQAGDADYLPAKPSPRRLIVAP